MVTREYIEHEIQKLDEKSMRKRNGLLIGDRKRYEDLQNALKYLELYESFNRIDDEYGNFY